MSFLRVKTVYSGRNSNKKYFYIYEVENYRDKKRIKQKTLKFLGKAIFLKKEKEVDFSFSIIKSFSNKEELIKYLLTKIAESYGFKKKKDVFYKENVIIDVIKNRITQNNSKVFLAINNGFLGEFTLNKLLKAENYKDLTKWLIQAGLIPKPKKFSQDDQNFNLISLIISKFGKETTVEEMDFEDFVKKIGY